MPEAGNKFLALGCWAQGLTGFMSEAHPERDAKLVNERVRKKSNTWKILEEANACIRVVKHGQYYCLVDIIRG